MESAVAVTIPRETSRREGGRRGMPDALARFRARRTKDEGARVLETRAPKVPADRGRMSAGHLNAQALSLPLDGLVSALSL